MTSQALGWGIVGLGRIAGSQIAPAIAASETGTLVSVVSRDQERAARFAAAHGAANGAEPGAEPGAVRALDDYAKMLGDPAVEAVYIATPNALHSDQVIAAARAGKHVLCDKPLALTTDSARRCVAECQAAGVRLGITFQTRYHDGLADIATLVRGGGIGTVVAAEVTMGAGRNLPRGWRTDPGLAGLGTLNNVGVHAFDLLRYLLGSEVIEVVALTGSEPGYQVDTTALVLLRFANAAIGYVNANQSVPHSRDDIVLYGTRGRVLARNLSRPGRDGVLSLTTADGERESPAGSHDAYRRVIDAFADAVRHGRDPSPSGEDGVRSVELTTAIATAIAERRVVTLTLGEACGQTVPHRAPLGAALAGRRGRALAARRSPGQGVLRRPRARRGRHADQVPARVRRARACPREQPLHRGARGRPDRERRAPAPRRLRLGGGSRAAWSLRVPGGLRGLRLVPRPLVAAPLPELARRGDLTGKSASRIPRRRAVM
jgi:1,5-anhydro-D-fructose reductase (1,5-anhydro-D-mannitol-forming)